MVLMRIVSLACFFCLTLSLGGVASAAESPDEKPGEQEIAKLIEQLDSAATADRDAAVKRLIQIGQSARPQVEAALKKSNGPVRRRLQLILGAYERRQVNRQKNNKQAFIDGDNTFAPPGWQDYRRVIGDDTICRKLLVKMYQAEPELLDAYENAPAKVAELFQERWDEWRRLSLLRHRYSVSNVGFPLEVAKELTALQPSSILVFFFVMGNEEIPIYTAIHDQFAKGVNFRPYVGLDEVLFQVMLGKRITSIAGLRNMREKVFGRASITPEEQKVIETCGALSTRFALPWLRRPLGEKASKVAKETKTKRRIWEAMKADLKSELPFLIDMVKSGPPNPPKDRNFLNFLDAVLAIGNLGDRSHVPVLEPLLACDEVIYRTKYTSQVRDIALAALVHMTGQDVGKYGFNPRVFGQFGGGLDPRLDGKLVHCRIIAFLKDSHRQKALAKWHAWAEENLKEGGEAANERVEE